MKSLDLLREARATISDVRHWTRNAAARNKDGDSISPYDSGTPVSFCSVGVIDYVWYRATGDDYRISMDHPAFEYLARGFGFKAGSNNVAMIVTANDVGSHEQVLAAFDRAIALAEEDSEGTPLPATPQLQEADDLAEAFAPEPVLI